MAWRPPQREAISIKGLTPGVAFDLATLLPSGAGGPDRRAAPRPMRRSRCMRSIATAWPTGLMPIGSISPGATDRTAATARLNVIVQQRARRAGARWRESLAGIRPISSTSKLDARDDSFHTFLVDLEVHDVQHLTRILAALRAADAVIQAERA